MRTLKQSRTEFAQIRGIRYHLRRWGNPNGSTLFLLHGWMDVSATFQFLVDALADDWNIIAPDWRGFGQSQWLHQPYWFGDLILDLDAILERFSPVQPAILIGHSMGGNIAGLYAGAKPERVAKLVTLEGFGHPSQSAEARADHYAQAVNGARQPPSHPTYVSLAHLADRMKYGNPRLQDWQAAFLAQHLACANCLGGLQYAVDPYHRLVSNHFMHHNADFLACWRNITAPVLWVAARDSSILKLLATADPPGSAYDYATRLGCFQNVCEVMMDDAGHNMQHDQPTVLAGVIEAFLTGSTIPLTAAQISRTFR